MVDQQEVYRYLLDKGYIPSLNIKITDRDPEFVQTFDVQKGYVCDAVVVTVPEVDIWMFSTDSQNHVGVGNIGGQYIEVDVMAYDPKTQMYRKVNSKYPEIALKGGQQLRFRTMYPSFDIGKSSISYSGQWNLFIKDEFYGTGMNISLQDLKSWYMKYREERGAQAQANGRRENKR